MSKARIRFKRIAQQAAPDDSDVAGGQVLFARILAQAIWQGMRPAAAQDDARAHEEKRLDCGPGSMPTVPHGPLRPGAKRKPRLVSVRETPSQSRMGK